MSKLDYMSFLLRIWKVNPKGKTEWRASLENPHTGSRYLFHDLSSLFLYLNDTVSDSEENSESGGELTKTGRHGDHP